MPLLRIDNAALRWSDVQLAPELRAHRLSVRVVPFLVDHQRVVLAGGDRRSQFFVRHQAAFDASWIKQQRETLSFTVPQLFSQLKKWKRYGLAIVAHQMD